MNLITAMLRKTFTFFCRKNFEDYHYSICLTTIILMIYQKDLTLRAVFLKFLSLIYDIGFCFRGHFYPFSRTTCSDSDFSWKQLTARTGNHVEWVGSVAIEH